MRPLYHLVAGGMWAYSRAAFRVTVLGPRRLELPPGTLLLATHRRETDVPVLCPPLWRRASLHRRRVSFAARDDMFLPGFAAGFPPGLPPGARRLLFGVGIGHWLPRVEVHPIRSAGVARLGELLREQPEAELDALLEPQELARFAARADGCGLAPPARACEALRGEFADLLWRPVGRADGAAAGLEGFWARRAAQAAADFRALVELVRAGGLLLLFPEGRPSPDGVVGPVERGVTALVRRARPAAVAAIGLGYDPLVRGRTRVAVAFGTPGEPPRDEEEAAGILRRAVPLTVGQLVAEAVAGGREPTLTELDGRAVAAVDAARAEGREVEPELLRPERRRARLASALARAREQPAAVAFLAREYRSARA